MGPLTLMHVLIWSILAPMEIGFAQSIEDLAPPRPAVPPTIDRDYERDVQLHEKKQRREKREGELAPKHPTPTEVRNAKLKEEALKPHDHTFMLEISLVGVGIQTTGERSGYTGEPTSHFNVFFRKKPNYETKKSSVWFGFRLAPFTGNGFYHGKPGDFAQTYFGPSIGVGSVEPGARDSGKDSEVSTHLSGWVITGGLSAVTLAGNAYSKRAGEGRSDFRGRGIYFDPPGLWGELRYVNIFYGGVGLNGVMGLQTGHEKVFVYGGIAATGWN